MNNVFIYVTTETVEDAHRIGAALVESHLAACANILPGMTSIYRWQGAIQRNSEVVLILKTRAELTDAAVAKVKALHPYQCPCAVALPISGGLPDFLNWIDAETRQ